MATVLSELGDRVAAAWTARRRDELAFPEIAVRALEEARLHEAYDFDALVLEILRADPLPIQSNRTESFGQPPVTIYLGEGFLVELLFWIDGLVSVHQHGFRGAFQVFAGSSVHSRYRFSERSRASSALLFGPITFLDAELLKAGAVRSIDAGASLIHATFHLERPTITIVVRTSFEQTGPQYDYHRPCLALDPFFSRPTLRKDLQVLRMLHRTRVDSYWLALRPFLERSDWLAAYLVLDQGYLLFSSTKDRAELYALARAKHGPDFDVVLPVLAESAERRTVIGWRDASSDEALRSLLAVLLTVPDKTSVLALLKERFPESRPEDLVTRCMDKLGLDEGAQIVGRLLMAGEPTHDEVRRALRRASYRVENDYEVLSAIRDVRAIPGFRALFSA